MEWTKEQEEIITSREKNIIVSAGAGSGKTAVLIERIFTLLKEDGVPLETMLLITFTKKAAGEMKERLRSRIEEFLENEEDAHLEQARKNLDQTQISTIHSFASECLRDHFTQLDLDINFKTIEGVEQNAYLDQSLEEVLDLEYEKMEPCFLKLLETYGDLKSDTGLRGAILDLYQISQCNSNPNDWLDFTGELYTSNQEEFLENELGQSLRSIFKKEINKGTLYLERCQHYVGQGAYEYEEDLEQLNTALEEARDFLETGKIAEFLGFFNSLKLKNLKTVKEKDDTHLQYIAQRDKLKNAFQKMNFDLKQHLDVLGTVKEEIAYLISITKNFALKYQELKKKDNLLDYNDLEHYLLKLLQDPLIRKNYQDYFSYIFVDEYQDTNDVQNTLFNYLKKENNLFLVGDVKQSIYGFRLADPDIFLGIFEEYSESKESQGILLNKNFRCSSPIIKGVNQLFDQIMMEDVSKIDYRGEGRLLQGSVLEEETKIELAVIDKDNVIGEDKPLGIDGIYAEAVYCADKIVEILGKKETIADPKAPGGRRLIDYRDISILMYSIKKATPVYLEVFKEYGIPLYGQVDTGFLESPSVAFMLDLLAVINNLNHDYALVHVLKSPVFGFSLEDLGQIRLAKRKGPFSEALFDYQNQEQEDDDDISKKIAYFFKKLENYQERVYGQSLSSFIIYLLEDTNYYFLMSGAKNGEQEAANLRGLIALAEKYESNKDEHLLGFLNYFRYLKEKKQTLGEENILAEGSNVVSLMTIHKSKGLEYPVVILAGLGTKWNFPRESILKIHNKLGIGAVYKSGHALIKTLAHYIISATNDKDTLEEKLNLLYVAMTRAKNRLYLVGFYKDLEKKSESFRIEQLASLMNAKSFLDCILPFIMYHNEVAEHYNLTFLPFEKYIATREENLKEELKFFGEDQEVEPIGPSKVERGIPRKVSVTELKKRDLKVFSNKDLLKESLNAKPDFMTEKKLSAVEKGTLFHLIMENIDLREVSSKEQVEEFLEELLQKGVILESEKDIIDVRAISNFLESSLGLRVRKSLRIEQEMPFNYRIEPKSFLKDYEGEEITLLQGVIDLFFEEEDGFVLIDFKTDQISRDTLKERVLAYKEQLYWYSRAIEDILEKPVKEMYLYFSHLRESVLVKREEKF